MDTRQSRAVASAHRDPRRRSRSDSRARRAGRRTVAARRLGPVRQLAGQAWTQATGKALPDIAGVDVDHVAGRQQLRVDVRIVVSLDHQAAEVGQAVADAVTTAVAGLTETLADIQIHIVEIDLEPHRAVLPTS
ncbi:hypothetical protein ACIA49_07810 [Kribbella sp. NPDC051587]|uniref:hypothetical protein n=1 Tax=Kribbella sp. NPDC051587 TaxID=3364119 RepID=UPI003788A8F5